MATPRERPEPRAKHDAPAAVTRRPYHPPVLRAFGRVRDLTRGGSDIKMENGGHPAGRP